MSNYLEELKKERAELIHKLDWLGIKSTGSERIERRIEVIDGMIRHANRNGVLIDSNG